MAWKFRDFVTKPMSLRKKLGLTVSGFSGNNAPWSETIKNGEYTLIDHGKGPEGSATLGVEDPHQISVSGAKGTGGNTYLLPWGSNEARICEVQQAHDHFFTYGLNGCGIFIAGGRSNPTVVHANTKSDDIPVTLDKEVMSNAYRQEYGIFVRALQRLGILDPSNTKTFVPGDHGYAGRAGVFGSKVGAKWTFYANIHGTSGATTVQIWP